MKRREFITLVGGAVAAWPLAARAQGDRMRRIGVLMPNAADDRVGQARLAAFLQGLQQLSWIIGLNVQIEYRWGAGDAERIRRDAAELVALAPDVILTGGATTVAPLLQATRTVPIVFANVTDPVGAGFIDSLARPGGNATGFAHFEQATATKWLELLRQIAPGVIRVAFALDPEDLFGSLYMRVLETAASSLDIRLTSVSVGDAAAFEQAVDAFARAPNGGPLVLSDAASG